jgi:hypothetical protein
MTTADVMWALENLIKALPPQKRSQAAGALLTIKNLLGVKDERV